LVAHRDDIYLRKISVDCIHRSQHCFRDLHRIGIGFLADRHTQPAHAVDPNDPPRTRVGVEHLSHLSEGDGRTIADQQHRVPQFVEVDKLGWSPKGYFIMSLIDLSGGKVQIGILDRSEDSVERKPQRIDPIGVELDPDFAIEAAPDIDLRNTGNPGKLLADLLLQ